MAVSFLSREEALYKLAAHFGGKPRFPLFVDLSQSHVQIIGGGAVAARRAEVLCRFCERITIIAPEICSALETLQLSAERRLYREGDCAGASLVLAATNSRQINHAVYLEAKSLGIPVNICDAPEECDFFFPAVVTCAPLVIGITADGMHHTLVRDTASQLRDYLQHDSSKKEHCDEKT